MQIEKMNMLELPTAAVAKEKSALNAIPDEITKQILSAIDNHKLSITIYPSDTLSLSVEQAKFIEMKGYKAHYNPGRGNLGLRGPPSQYPLDHEYICIMGIIYL